MPTATLMPLENFRFEIGFMPFHFWQLASASKVPLNSACNTLLREYSWLSTDSAGREEIRSAIANAEALLFEYLRYDPGTRYREESYDLGYLQRVDGTPPWNYSQFGYGWGYAFGSALYNRTPALLTLKPGKIKKIATLTWALGGDSAVQLTDNDGDGLLDTFTATLADAATDLNDFELRFTIADRPPQTANDAAQDWSIRPVTFTRAAGIVTATGPAWIIVKPTLYGRAIGFPGTNYTAMGVDSSGALDPDTLTNYVANVSFYKKSYTKPNTAYLDVNACGTVTTIECCATIADGDTGEILLDFSLLDLNTLPCPSSFTVQSMRINYEAGDNQAKWQKTTTRLALAELRHRISACEQANREVWNWQEDLAVVGSINAGGGGNSKRIANKHLENPLGTRRGHVYAWEQIAANRLHRALNVVTI